MHEPSMTTTQHASNAMLKQMVAELNGAGIVPILSLDNRLAASNLGLSISMPCALPEDDLLAQLAGLEFARFYENWPQSFWIPGGNDLAAAMIANAILEANLSVPAVLHGGGSCPAPQRQISRPGQLGGAIEFLVATYLIVQSAGTLLSVSNNWYDKDFCWWPEWDVDFGTPTGLAVRTSTHSWIRNYTRANVVVDVSTAQHGSVYLLA